MKSFIVISFIYFSFIGLGQNSISLDTLADSRFLVFIDDFMTYSEDPEIITQYNVVDDINSSCDMNVAYNKIVSMGYRLAWISKHKGGDYSNSEMAKADSIALVPLCDSLDSDKGFFFLFEHGASSHSIGSKYIVIESSLPTGDANDIRYYFIKHD